MLSASRVKQSGHRWEFSCLSSRGSTSTDFRAWARLRRGARCVPRSASRRAGHMASKCAITRRGCKTEYFECLARHGVTHVYNSWTEMPPDRRADDAMAGSQTNPELVAARFLLKPGRKYDEAVKAFATLPRTRKRSTTRRENPARHSSRTGRRSQERKRLFSSITGSKETHYIRTMLPGCTAQT
jgi:hypothetical protein